MELILQHYFSVENTWYLAFFLDSHNLKQYILQYLDSNSRIFGNEDIEDEELSSVLSDWVNSNSTPFAEIMGELSLEDCADNNQMKALVLAQQVISSKQREIDELLIRKIRTESDIKKARRLIADIREEYQKAIKEAEIEKEKNSPNGKSKSKKTDKKEPTGQKEAPVAEEETNKEETDNGQANFEQ